MTQARTKGQRRRAKRNPKRHNRAKTEWVASQVDAEPLDNSPTPQRISMGAYTVGSTRRVWHDVASTPLRRALHRRKLALRQVEAGEWMEGLQRALSGSPGQRSCLDLGPRGEGTTDQERIAHIARLHAQAMSRLTHEQRAVVRSVCYEHHPIGDMRPSYRRYRQLFLALMVIADWREGSRSMPKAA